MKEIKEKQRVEEEKKKLLEAFWDFSKNNISLEKNHRRKIESSAENQQLEKLLEKFDIFK